MARETPRQASHFPDSAGLCLITSQGPDTDNPGLEADRAKSPEDHVSHGTFLGPPAWCKERSQLPVLAGTLSPDTNQDWNG